MQTLRKAREYEVGAKYEPRLDSIYIHVCPAIGRGFKKAIDQLVDLPDGVEPLLFTSTYERRDDYTPFTELAYPVMRNNAPNESAQNMASQIAYLLQSTRSGAEC